MQHTLGDKIGLQDGPAAFHARPLCGPNSLSGRHHVMEKENQLFKRYALRGCQSLPRKQNLPPYIGGEKSLGENVK